MGLRKGDFIVTEYSGMEGILLEFKYSEYNSYYHKAVVYCTFAPPQSNAKLNTVVEVNANIVTRRR